MKNRGFTLIELLVVIAIIGLLAAIAMVSMRMSQVKARDNRRVADLKQLQVGLEFFYDSNGYYPRYDGGGTVACTDGWAAETGTYETCWADLQTKLGPYMRLPRDPQHASRVYWYRTRNSGQGYYLVMVPESGSVGLGAWCYPSMGYCIGVNY